MFAHAKLQHEIHLISDGREDATRKWETKSPGNTWWALECISESTSRTQRKWWRENLSNCSLKVQTLRLVDWESMKQWCSEPREAMFDVVNIYQTMRGWSVRKLHKNSGVRDGYALFPVEVDSDLIYARLAFARTTMDLQFARNFWPRFSDWQELFPSKVLFRSASYSILLVDDEPIPWASRKWSLAAGHGLQNTSMRLMVPIF